MSDSNTSKSWTFDTKAIHSGQEFEQWKNLEIVPPIVTSMTYYQNDPSKMTGYFYSRINNPTRDVLEKCLASLEGSKYGLVFPSGCAALTALLHLLKPGDHIVSSDEQYGGSRIIFNDFTKVQGAELDYVDSTDVKEVEKAIKPNTKFVWIESPSNPCMKVSDIEAISKLAHSYNKDIIVAVDNTYMTPYYQRPLDLGADISMYSLTKYMNGHNDVQGGAILLNDENMYEKVNFVQTHNGSVLSPFDCYLVNRGLKTLHLRMPKHNENSVAVAKYLEKHPKVLGVSHPALPSHPQYELSKKQSSGYCGMLAFHIDGTQTDAKNFIRNLRVISSSGSLGSLDSFAMIPVCVSHFSMPRETRMKLGIYDSTIRLSVGAENINDLIEDLEQAFKKTFS